MFDAPPVRNRRAAGAQRHNTDVSSNFTSHCATTESEEERGERPDRMAWKVQWENGNLAKERKERRWVAAVGAVVGV